MSSHPLYHTIYETFHLVEKFLDPTFEVGHKRSQNTYKREISICLIKDNCAINDLELKIRTLKIKIKVTCKFQCNS